MHGVQFCSATSVQLQIGARVWREPESLLLPFPLGFFPYPTKRARQVFGVPYNSTVECSTKSKNDFLALRASDGLLVGPLTPAKDEGSQQFTTVVTGYLEVTFDNMRDSSFDVEVAYGRDNKITTDEDEYLIHVDVKDRSGECYIPFLISGNLSYRNFWPPHKETYDAYNWEKGNYVVKINLTNGISGSATTEFSVK